MDVPDWLDEIVWSADGPPWLAMGLSRCDEARWLLPDEHRVEELAERHRLLAERHDDVFLAAPGTEQAGAEVLALVEDWVRRHRPDLASEPARFAHPLEAAARLVQEDLCLMVPRDGGFHLDAACLCFPSHWRLRDKFGGSASEIHEPVPGYRAELDDKVGRYLERLRPGVIGARRNWTVHETPALHAPTREPPPGGQVPSPPALWLRSERQTLRRLAGSGAALFTIRVQQAPLGVVAARPDRAAALAARLRAEPAELTEMNGLAAHRVAVLTWLDQVVRPAG